MGESQEYVFVGTFSEIHRFDSEDGVSEKFYPGVVRNMTAAELADADACRLHFVSRADFDSIFEPSDKVFMSPQFVGEWPAQFNEKLEKARNIVKSRRG